jgi:uncharacterized membrane protein
MIAGSSMLQGEDRSTRWLALVSLAINLFFIGTAGALIVRHYWAPSVMVSAPIDRSAGARIERIAATLPSTDAEVMRVEFRAKATMLDAARTDFERAVNRIRETFRSEPYNEAATRVAMSEARLTKLRFDELLQDLIASSAAKMSVTGRAKLAEYSPTRPASSQSR